MNVGWEPVVPTRPQEQSDRQWVSDFERRQAAARMRPLSPVIAAEVESQNRGLSDQARRMALSSEQRRTGSSWTSRPRVSAEDEALLRSYYRQQAEAAPVIARAKARSARAGAAVRSSAGYGPTHCVYCRDYNVSPMWSAQIHANAERDGVQL